MEEKQCSECKRNKPLSEFYYHKSGNRVNQPYNQCKECMKLKNRLYYADHREKCLEHNRRYKGNLPYTENKDCPSYLGVAVAEKVLSRFFDHAS